MNNTVGTPTGETPAVSTVPITSGAALEPKNKIWRNCEFIKSKDGTVSKRTNAGKIALRIAYVFFSICSVGIVALADLIASTCGKLQLLKITAQPQQPNAHAGASGLSSNDGEAGPRSKSAQQHTPPAAVNSISTDSGSAPPPLPKTKKPDVTGMRARAAKGRAEPTEAQIEQQKTLMDPKATMLQSLVRGYLSRVREKGMIILHPEFPNETQLLVGNPHLVAFYGRGEVFKQKLPTLRPEGIREYNKIKQSRPPVPPKSAFPRKKPTGAKVNPDAQACLQAQIREQQARRAAATETQAQRRNREVRNWFKNIGNKVFFGGKEHYRLKEAPGAK